MQDRKAVVKLEKGHRYLFKEVHVDGDHPFEASIEEISPSCHWVKLRHFPGGTFEWKSIQELEVFEELPSDSEGGFVK
jgi:hypothetical protein